MKVIFILGTGHCGSTLLDMILGAHPDITGVGEIDTINKELEQGDLCTCGRKLPDCSLWSHKIEEIKSWRGMQVHRGKRRFLQNSSSYEYIDTNRPVHHSNFCVNQQDLYDFVLKKQKSKVIVDSSKNPDRVELISECEEIEPVILHLVRDGRGVLWSYKKKYNKTLAFIWKWIASNLKVEIIRRRSDIPYLFVRYHDLANNPEKEIKRILQEVNVDFEPSMLSFRDENQHQVSGNRIRLQSSEAIEEDLEWQNKLSFLDRGLFMCIAGWLNWYYAEKYD